MDLGTFERKVLEEHGILPDQLYRLTPHQFVALFFADGNEPARKGGIDRVALMKGHNADRAKKGLPPLIPAWMFPEVPRG